MKANRLILLLFISGLLFIPFCEPDKKMSVETGDVSNISTTSADVSGTVIDVGEGATQHGHCYGTSANPSISGTKTTLGVAATGNFTSNLTELEPSTTYYVRAYTSLGSEAAYGSEASFTTASAALAELTTTAITSITKNSAVTGGNITSEGGTSVTARGVCWNVASGPTIANSKTTDGSGAGSFASSITGLTANTKYYVRAYATNSGGTAYGNEISFTTSPEVAVAPTVTTVEVTSITSNSAVSGGDVTSEGGAPVTAKGVCWSTTANPTITSSKTTDGTGSGSFVSNLTNLNPGTTYYVRAYATNSAGTSYGNEYNFTTEIVVPTLSTITVTSITSTTAVSGGNITKDGGSAVTVRGVCWSTSQNPTIDDKHTSDGPGTGTYTSNLTGLTGNTTYYVRAYATNSEGTAYGNELNFNTGAVVPILTTAAITSITSTTATSGGEISSDGGSPVTARGVCWSISADPTTANTKTSDGSGTGSFTSSLAGLIPGTTYHVRAYATNSIGTAYGNDVSFTTSTVIPSVTTSAIINITSTTATSGGNVTSDGGASVIARGVCWSTTANPTTADSKTNDGTGTGSYTSNITGLTPGVSYHVRAYATNSVGTVYGEDLTFTAGAVLATVTTTAVTNITSTTGASGGNVTSDGGTSVTARGVCWNTSPNPTITNYHTSDGIGLGSFTSTLTGLTANTTYYVRAYATNGVGTSYASNELSFTTNVAVPTLTTIAINSITDISAASGGDITNSGGASITARGVCWSTSPGPTTAGNKTNDGVGTGVYSSSIAGLTSNTNYWVRAYATNSAGTGYGNELSFPTLAIVSTGTISNISDNSASAGGSITSGGGADITGRGVCWNTSQNPTVNNSKSIDGTGTGVFTSSLTGLIPNTLYYVRAYATNAGGTAYGTPEQPFTTFCTAPAATTGANTCGTTTASLNGTVNANGFSTAVTFEYGTTTSYGSTATASPGTVTGSSNTTVSAGLTGLTSNTLYHYRVKAVNCSPTPVYGSDMTFTSLASLTTTLVSYTQTTASINGSVAVGGGESIAQRGVCWSKIPNPTISNERMINGSGTGSFTCNLSGLTTNTTYYVRAYATNNGGTAYGNEINFTTPCPTSLAVTHTAGDVAAVTKTVTYGIVQANLTGQNKCWITQNLGADNQASSATDATEAAAGWYWQFNLKQGYKHDGTTRTPNTTWITTIDENSDWIAANDPCTILLGTGWRIPTNSEWTNADNNGGWDNYSEAYSSVLKLHTAGYLANWSGALQIRGSNGYYWSSTQSTQYPSRSWVLDDSSYQCLMGELGMKENGFSVRCLRD